MRSRSPGSAHGSDKKPSEITSYGIVGRLEAGLTRDSGIYQASCQIGRVPAHRHSSLLRVASGMHWKRKRAILRSDATALATSEFHRIDPVLAQKFDLGADTRCRFLPCPERHTFPLEHHSRNWQRS